MTILDSFSNYLASFVGAVLGQDMFIGQAPSSNKVNDPIWWIIQAGGDITQTNTTGEKAKEYRFDVYYRSRDYKAVQNALFTLESNLNSTKCISLVGYTVLSAVVSSFPVDDDLDNEDRKIGFVQITLTIYKENSYGIS